MIKTEERKLVGLVRHFKYETLTDEEKKQNKYVYQVLADKQKYPNIRQKYRFEKYLISTEE